MRLRISDLGSTAKEAATPSHTAIWLLKQRELVVATSFNMDGVLGCWGEEIKRTNTGIASDSVDFESRDRSSNSKVYLFCLDSEAPKNDSTYIRPCTRRGRFFLLSYTSNKWPLHIRSSSDNYLRAFFKSLSPALRSTQRRINIFFLECANFLLSLVFLLLPVAAYFDLLPSLEEFEWQGRRRSFEI